MQNQYSPLLFAVIDVNIFEAHNCKVNSLNIFVECNDTNQRFPFVMQEGRKSATEESNETKSLHSDDEYEGGLC